MIIIIRRLSHPPRVWICVGKGVIRAITPAMGVMVKDLGSWEWARKIVGSDVPVPEENIILSPCVRSWGICSAVLYIFLFRGSVVSQQLDMIEVNQRIVLSLLRALGGCSIEGVF